MAGPQVDENVGRTLGGRYMIDGALGKGAMGVVYRATQTTSKRAVAVKLLRPEFASSEEHAERFLREAKAVARVRSPNIIEIVDLGRDVDGSLWFAMELLDGRLLADVLKQAGRMPAHLVVHIGQQICIGLAAAHDVGIVHRDLKAGNVMLVTRDGDPNFVKVFDFGIAKDGGEEAPLTQVGMLVGTFDCMSPEQIRGQKLDARTDVYALGTLLYRLLSNTATFKGSNPVQLLTAQLDQAPESLLKRAPDAGVPPPLDAVVLKCLEKKPEDRYPSMAAVSIALAQALDSTGSMDRTSPGLSLPPEVAALRAAAAGARGAPTSNPNARTLPTSTPIARPLAPPVSRPAVPAASTPVVPRPAVGRDPVRTSGAHQAIGSGPRAAPRPPSGPPVLGHDDGARTMPGLGGTGTPASARPPSVTPVRPPPSVTPVRPPPAVTPVRPPPAATPPAATRRPAPVPAARPPPPVQEDEDEGGNWERTIAAMPPQDPARALPKFEDNTGRATIAEDGTHPRAPAPSARTPDVRSAPARAASLPPPVAIAPELFDEPDDEPPHANAAMPWDQDFEAQPEAEPADEGGSTLRVVLIAAAVTFALGVVATLALVFVR